jgi:hypothetical protein
LVSYSKHSDCVLHGIIHIASWGEGREALAATKVGARLFAILLIILFAVIMSFMLDGRNVSVVRDDSSSHSLVAMSFVSLDRSRDGVFRALVTLLKGDSAPRC